MLKNGRFSIFLDGLNEIEKSIRAKMFTQIKNMLSLYPNNFFLIATRPQAYNREFDDVVEKRSIPVFILQKMQDSQISNFLERNGKHLKEYISKEIAANPRLKKIVQTPLMMKMLIAVVDRDGVIPNEKGKIIRSFIFSLYDREQKNKYDFDKDTFHLLMCNLGYETRDLTGSNSGLDRDEYILPILQDRKEQLGITINLLKIIKQAIDLSILVVEENQISYSHELYQEYYAAEYIHQLSSS